MSTPDSTPDAAPASRLASLTDLSSYLNDSGAGTTSRTGVLERMLDAASERLNAVRQFYPSPEIETRTVYPDGEVMVSVPDLRGALDLELVADGRAIDRVRLLQRKHDQPAHALLLYEPVGTLQITGWWGFAEVPVGIEDACLAWAARAWFSRLGRQADVVATGDQQTSYFARMPSYVRVALEPYEIPGL